VRRMVLAVAVVLFAGGCGDEPSTAERTLAEGADRMEQVRSGTVRLKVAASTSEQPDREVGFEIEGPFALAEEEGALPKARFSLTNLLGRQSHVASFASDGKQATVTQGGRTRTVEDDAVRHLRGRADAEEGLARLHIDEWARSPRVADDGRIVAEVDVPAALNDILAVAADVGAHPQGVGSIDGEDAERLRRSVRSSRLEVEVDEETDVVRQVRMLVAFGADAQDDVARVLERLAGVRLAFELDLNRVELARDR
jgi:hypothetical protein